MKKNPKDVAMLLLGKAKDGDDDGEEYKEEEEGVSHEAMASDIMEAVEEGSRKDLAMALKSFVRACMDEYGPKKKEED